MRSLVARAEGNPLYLEQIIRSVVEGSDAERRVVIRVSERGLASLPPALEGLLVSRIDRLPPGARRVAQIAAVTGRSFLRRVLEMVAGPDGLEDDLSVLLRADLIREHRLRPETEYIFTHGLIQEAAASTLTRARVRDLHGLVAHALEQVGAEDYGEVIAHHYAESAETDKALSYLEAVGGRAASLYANAQAIDAWDRAIAFARERGDAAAARRITEKLAGLLARVGSPRSVELYRELAGVTSDPNDRASLLAVGGWAALDVGLAPESEAFVEEGLATPGIGAAARVGLLHVQARASWRSGNQNARMGSLLEEAERLMPGIAGAEPASEDSPGLPAAIRHAWLRTIYHELRGEADELARWEAVYVDLADRTGDAVKILDAHHDLAVSRFEAGSLREAAAMMREVYDEARAMGYERMIASAGGNLVYLLSLLGEIEEGLGLGAELRPGLTIPGRKVIALTYLAELESLAGDREEAVADLRQAMGDAAQVGLEVQGLEARVALAGLQVAEGDLGSLRATLEECLRIAEDLDAGLFVRPLACRWLGEVMLRAGEPEEAERYLRRGLDSTERWGTTWAVPLWRLLGRAQESKVPGSGRESFDRALALATSTGMQLEIGRVQVDLARAGLVSDPAAAVAEARRIFERCGSKRDLAELG